MRNLRRVSQGIFLTVFLFFLLRTEYNGTNELNFPVKIFLDFDPLNGLASLLASWSLPQKWSFALVTVLMTVLVGRFFCGWACPFGTIHHMVGSLKKKLEAQREKWLKVQRVKYLILVVVLAASALSLQLTGLLDPLSLLIRSLGIGVNPAYNLIGHSAFDAAYKTGSKPLVALTEPTFNFLRDNHILSFQVPYFKQSLLISLVFLGIVLLNLMRKHFWCRYLCPLGALLGLLSRFSFLRLHTSETCDACGRCVKECPAEADPYPKGHWKVSECFYCWNCVASCKQKATSFHVQIPPLHRAASERIDLGRRRLLVAGLSGVAAAPFFIGSGSRLRSSPRLIRPPGAADETLFLGKCVRCGECMKVCLTNVIQPAFAEAGLEGLWTPVLDMKRGYCEYSCTLCGQVCPTQAIRRLGVEEKQKLKIGLAFIDTSRCLPYAFRTECIVCEEHCPTPKKAIEFEETEVLLRDGSRKILKQPRVIPELCIGCGICEYKCPVVDKPAIYVTSIGESRSRNNQLLLGSSYG